MCCNYNALRIIHIILLPQHNVPLEELHVTHSLRQENNAAVPFVLKGCYVDVCGEMLFLTSLDKEQESRHPKSLNTAGGGCFEAADLSTNYLV